jgi:hypothetical protein
LENSVFLRNLATRENRGQFGLVSNELKKKHVEKQVIVFPVKIVKESKWPNEI